MHILTILAINDTELACLGKLLIFLNSKLPRFLYKITFYFFKYLENVYKTL